MTQNSERPIAASAFKVWEPGDSGDKAEYATPDKSMVDSGFYTGERGLPWHVEMSRRLDLPELMQDAGRLLTGAEALAAAGLDFTVEKVPLSFMTHRDKYSKKHYKDIPQTYATVRTDSMEALGVGVKEGYRVLQNEEAFAFADDLVDSGQAKYESAGALYGGRWVFLSMEMPNDIHVEGDPSEYRLFLVVSNGHDGKHPVQASVTVERTVCRNTLTLAHTSQAVSSWKVRHTTSLDGRLEAARSALGLSFRAAESFAQTATDLVQKPLAERQVDAILADLFPLTEKQTESIDLGKRSLDSTVQGKVRDLNYTSTSVEPISGTAYGVLNAVTEYLDHEAVYRGRLAPASDIKADSLVWEGQGEKTKQRVLAALREA